MNRRVKGALTALGLSLASGRGIASSIPPELTSECMLYFAPTFFEGINAENEKVERVFDDKGRLVRHISTDIYDGSSIMRVYSFDKEGNAVEFTTAKSPYVRFTSYVRSTFDRNGHLVESAKDGNGDGKLDSLVRIVCDEDGAPIAKDFVWEGQSKLAFDHTPCNMRTHAQYLDQDIMKKLNFVMKYSEAKSLEPKQDTRGLLEIIPYNKRLAEKLDPHNHTFSLK